MCGHSWTTGDDRTNYQTTQDMNKHHKPSLNLRCHKIQKDAPTNNLSKMLKKKEVKHGFPCKAEHV
jgi:hypothetical protein